MLGKTENSRKRERPNMRWIEPIKEATGVYRAEQDCEDCQESADSTAHHTHTHTTHNSSNAMLVGI